jgi:hypothetical protein
MSPRPSMDDYVDVAERIRQFKAEYPEGSLQSSQDPKFQVITEKREDGAELTHVFVMYCAAAYRTPDDPRPGIGWAWEPVPGPTPFTRDSELMNAETSAWGRAIVALGFETKKIASANEVRNRQASSEREHLSAEQAPAVAEPSRSEGSSGFQAPLPATEKPAKKGTLGMLKQTVEALQKGFPSPDPNHKYWDDVQVFMHEQFGKTKTADLTEHEAQMVVLAFEKRLIEAQRQTEMPVACIRHTPHVDVGSATRMNVHAPRVTRLAAMSGGHCWNAADV